MEQRTDYTNERWAPIEGYDGIFLNRYEVSDHGRVRGLSERKSHNDGILKNKITKNNYHFVTVSVPQRYGKPFKTMCLAISRLVAFAFVENPEDYNEVDHINMRREDNHYTNLQWIRHDINCRRSQAYEYKLWFKENPEEVFTFNSRRQLEQFAAHKKGRAKQINVGYIIKYKQGVYCRDGFAVTCTMKRGSETFKQRKKMGE